MLCILLNYSRIEIYGEDGRSFIISLPCKVHRIWSFDHKVLILERKPSPSSSQVPTINPMVFYLTNPLEELKPICVFLGQHTSDDEDILMEPQFEYMCNDNELITHVYSDKFLLTYNLNSRLVSIYCIFCNESETGGPSEWYLERVQNFNNNDFSFYLTFDTMENLQATVNPLNSSDTDFILFILHNQSLIAFKISNQILTPLFSKKDVISISEFNYPFANQALFNGNSNGCMHLMLVKESSSRDNLLLVLNGEFIMWENHLEANMYSKIDHVVENRFSLITSRNTSFRYSLDISPSSKLVQDCFSVAQAVLPLDLYSSIFFDFQKSKSDKSKEWDIFVSLIFNLAFDGTRNIAEVSYDDPWKMMEFIEQNKGISETKIDFSNNRTNKTAFLENLPLLLLSLHLLYENYKLRTTEWSNCELLAPLLFDLATAVRWTSYIEVYQRDSNYKLVSRIPENNYQFKFSTIPANLKHVNIFCTSGAIVPSINGWIEDIFTKRVCDSRGLYPVIFNCAATDLSRKICRFVSLFVSNEDNYRMDEKTDMHMDIHTNHTLSELPSYERIVMALLEEGFYSISDLEFLPFGVLIPIREALVQCRNSNQPVTRTPSFCKLIEREDLAINYNQNQTEQPLRDNQVINEVVKTAALFSGQPADTNSQEIEEDIGYMIWNEDRRLEQVSKLLDSSKPTQIQKQTLQLSEDDLDGFDPNDAPDLQRHILLNIKQQVLSFCIGRGMMTMSSKKQINSLTNDATSNIINIPPILLTAKLKRNRAIMSIDISKISLESDSTSVSSTQWAEFHNGVASGLVIGKECKITKEWIMFHKPNKRGSQYNRQNSDSVTHAGLLFALGLQGHLKCLGPTDIYGYLQQRHEATTIGILLGLSCSYIGTQDQYITRSLSLYIPSLVVGMSDMEMPMEVSGSALMGIGLLYTGCCHRFMTEVLLGELSRPPNDNSTNTRESYSLSAGFALGLVHLGKGATGNSSELKMDQRLISYMTGGKRPEYDMFVMMASKNKSQKSASKTGNGLITNSTEVVNNTCSRIKENEKFVNVDVTGPGACIALTLKYLKTNDLTIASEMKVPDSRYMLDYVRPDMVTLRLLGSSLIMWDDIQNTEDWIKSKIPTLFHSMQPDAVINSTELSKIYAYVISGCCLSIGLKFAGSHDTKAFNLLLDITQQVTKMRLRFYTKKNQDPAYYVKLDRHVADRTITSCLLSLSCVMAGSGNVDIIRIVRQLRFKNVSSPTTQNGGYGIQMALSMSLGLLFLGSGRCSLSTNNMSIACLLCSLYPIFPQTTTDNRYHSQALRHMYILATENRLIETIDIDTNETCHVPIEVETIHGDVLKKLSPCLIPEVHLIKKITTQNDRYYPLTITNFPLKSHIIYVKKKSGYLPYKDDPKGIRSTVHSTFISNLVDQNPDAIVKLFERMSYHKHIGPYVKYRIFNPNNLIEDPNLTNAIQSLSLNDNANGNIALLLYHSLIDSLINDCPDVLYVFESLLHSLHLITDASQGNRNSVAKSISVSNFKHLFAYYEARDVLLYQANQNISFKPLISMHYLQCVKSYLESYFGSMSIDWQSIIGSTHPSNCHELGSYSIFYSLPYLQLIYMLTRGKDNPDAIVSTLQTVCSSSTPRTHLETLVNSMISNK